MAIVTTILMVFGEIVGHLILALFLVAFMVFLAERSGLIELPDQPSVAA